MYRNRFPDMLVIVSTLDRGATGLQLPPLGFRCCMNVPPSDICMILDGRAMKPAECPEAEYGQAEGSDSHGVMEDSGRATHIPSGTKDSLPRMPQGCRKTTIGCSPLRG